jgi:hypothetical protein
MTDQIDSFDVEKFQAVARELHQKIAEYVGDPQWGTSSKRKYLDAARALVNAEEALRAL